MSLPVDRTNGRGPAVGSLCHQHSKSEARTRGRTKSYTTKAQRTGDCGSPFVKSKFYQIHFCGNPKRMGIELEKSARVASHVLILILSLAKFVYGGITSDYVRSTNLSADMPLDSDVFRVPPGYNAPQQASSLFSSSFLFCPLNSCLYVTKLVILVFWTLWFCSVLGEFRWENGWWEIVCLISCKVLVSKASSNIRKKQSQKLKLMISSHNFLSIALLYLSLFVQIGRWAY